MKGALTGAATGIFAILLSASLLLSAAHAEPGKGRIDFIALGDMPYTDGQVQRLDGPIRDAIHKAAAAEGAIPFLIHLGDFKVSDDACGDDLFLERYAQMMALHPGPVFYTPGDNEWTDCDKDSLSPAMSPLDRLRRLREIFFVAPPKVPMEWALSIQSDYPENRLWRVAGVQFATVHIVGTNNGRAWITLDDIAPSIAEVDTREEAALRWIDAAFDEASDEADALVLAFHADMSGRVGKPACGNEPSKSCDGYKAIRQRIFDRAADYRKPVLLLHGDTYDICLERVEKAGDANLWRLNAPGDDKYGLTSVDAARISVMPGNPDRPFAADTLLDGEALPGSC